MILNLLCPRNQWAKLSRIGVHRKETYYNACKKLRTPPPPWLTCSVPLMDIVLSVENNASPSDYKNGDKRTEKLSRKKRKALYSDVNFRHVLTLDIANRSMARLFICCLATVRITWCTLHAWPDNGEQQNYISFRNRTPGKYYTIRTI